MKKLSKIGLVAGTVALGATALIGTAPTASSANAVSAKRTAVGYGVSAYKMTPYGQLFVATKLTKKGKDVSARIGQVPPSWCQINDLPALCYVRKNTIKRDANGHVKSVLVNVEQKRNAGRQPSVWVRNVKLTKYCVDGVYTCTWNASV